MRFIPNRARDIVAEETPLQTAVNAAVEVKKSGVRVFSWGFGTGVSLATLQQMATYIARARFARRGHPRDTLCELFDTHSDSDIRISAWQAGRCKLLFVF